MPSDLACETAHSSLALTVTWPHSLSSLWGMCCNFSKPLSSPWTWDPPAVTARSPFLSQLNHSFSHTPQGQPNRLKTWRRIWGQEGRTLESLTLVQIDASCSHTSKSSSLANELLICILFCTQTLGLLGKSTPPSCSPLWHEPLVSFENFWACHFVSFP